MAKKAVCPICARETHSVVGKNKLHDGRRRPVFACGACGHKFCSPPPSLESLRARYQGGGYFKENCGYQGITSLDPAQWESYLAARQIAFDKHIVPYFAPGQKLVIAEIGCLEGSFLNSLARQGHTVTGFETNAEIAAQGSRAFGIEIQCRDIETEQPQLQADAVLSFHTFEHLRDPLAATRKAYDMLRPGGVLLLELPCDDAEMNNWDHLHFFTESSLRAMMAQCFDAPKLVPNSYLCRGKMELGSLYAVGRKSSAAEAADCDRLITRRSIALPQISRTGIEPRRFAKISLGLIAAIVIAFAAVTAWMDEKRTLQEIAYMPHSDMPFKIP